ncbi:MAG: hypothetical protein ACJAUQ_000049 [Maribacter sp.]|jgi:hypothetical protein
MKGIIFTEFLEMVESKFGLEAVDTIIESANLPSQGIYTSVGTYDFNEMVILVTELDAVTHIGFGELIYAFGLFLFTSLLKAHPEVIQSYTSPLSMLYAIEDCIHVHVQKLYSEAELPTFKILEKTDSSLTMIYSSSRVLYRLTHSLIEKTFEHFNKKATVSCEVLKEDGSEVKFNIVQNG